MQESQVKEVIGRLCQRMVISGRVTGLTRDVYRLMDLL